MELIGQNLVFSILNRKCLFCYLKREEVLELSLSCKFIYFKCTEFRFNKLAINSNRAQEIAVYINFENSSYITNSSRGILINSIVNSFRTHSNTLYFYNNSYYPILVNIAAKFPKITKLQLSNFALPKEILQCVFDSVQELDILCLEDVICTYSISSAANTYLIFPKYLRRFYYCGLYELESNVEGFLKHNDLRKDLPHRSILANIDILPNSITSLNWLLILCPIKYSYTLANQLVCNNPRLECIDTELEYLTMDSLIYISNNNKLKKLALTLNLNESKFLNSSFPQFPSIKSVEFFGVNLINSVLVTKFLNNCPNLEALEYYLFPDLYEHLLEQINNLPNLNRLKVTASPNCNSKFPTLVKYSNLQYIDLINYDPMLINWELLDVLPKFKHVRIELFSRYLRFDIISKKNYFNALSSWRAVFNSDDSIINCWKI